MKDTERAITPEEKREIQSIALGVLRDELDHRISLQEVLTHYYDDDEEDLER